MAKTKMTDNGDGTYYKTFTAVSPMDAYQIKVVKNGKEWIGDAQDNNVTFNVTDTCDVTVTYNTADKSIAVTGSGVTNYTFALDSVVVVGNGSGAWLNGKNWVPNAAENVMTEVAPKVYEISYENVPESEYYTFKFAINGAWTDNFGGKFKASGEPTEAKYDGESIYFTSKIPGTITLRLDLTNFDYATKTGAKFTITLPQDPDPAFYMKHPWGNSDEWTWKRMEKNTNSDITVRDNYGNIIDWGWTVRAPYGGHGVLINTQPNDVGVKAFDNPSIPPMKLEVGDSCVFAYFDQTQIAAIYPDKYLKMKLHFTPEPGTYSAPLTLHVVCENPTSPVVSIKYCINNGFITPYDSAKGITLTESALVSAYIELEESTTTYLINGQYIISEPTGVTDVTVPTTSGKAAKVLEQGRIIIKKDGKKYDLMGKEIRY